MPKLEKCQDDWHLTWKELIEKYGSENADNHYKPYRTCLTCDEKKIYGD
jgi:hypothetical protein